MHLPLTTAYLRWAATRAALWRGYWLVTSVYLVVVADLGPGQLVLIGTAQALTVLAAEIPAGVLADTVSRRRSIVVAQVLTGGGMVLAGLVTTFPMLVVSQCLCGLGWAFSSGADVAWLTDELGPSPAVDRVLAAQGRWQLAGGPAGMLGFGALAQATSLSVAIVVSGVAMVGLAGAVARWPEAGFTRAPKHLGRRRHDAAAILRDGARLARGDRVVGAALVATVLLHGGFEAYGRLLQRHVLALGLPAEPAPIVWFTAVGLVGCGLGAVALWLVQQRVDTEAAPRRTYAAACALGSVGLLLFAHAPDGAGALVGVLLVSGVADPVSRVATTVWVNRRTTGEVRATVHSFVSQAEHLGELVLGLALAAVAGAASVPAAVTGSALLLAVAGAVAWAVDGERAASFVAVVQDAAVNDDAVNDRFEVQRTIPAPPGVIFDVVRSPDGHVAIDASGMLQSATGSPASAVGDTFVVHMDREALGDLPMGKYDVTVTITGYEQDRFITWEVSGENFPSIGHYYGYRLEPAADGDGTLVTSIYDWSGVGDQWRAPGVWPIIPEQALKATLGILERTVRSR